MLERQRVMNFRSKAMEGGNPKKSSPDSIDYGELAVGYHVLNERLFFKNDDDEIVEIPVQNIVKFRDWQINEEDGSYYWTTEREFHNLSNSLSHFLICFFNSFFLSITIIIQILSKISKKSPGFIKNPGQKNYLVILNRA